MSEPVSQDVSTESLCTVIETNSNNYFINKRDIDSLDSNNSSSLNSLDSNRISNSYENNCKHQISELARDYLDNSTTTTTPDSCDTDKTDYTDQSVTSNKDLKETSLRKLKKSVNFDLNDEKIRKFIGGEPIIDQQNPFKLTNGIANGNCKRREKKTPPPVPDKHSKLSITKSVSQQLKEREREKERERLRNETNNRRCRGVIKSPSDEFITTEEVLNQSKYVKTYIKNPDPYFYYDPSVLARLKYEELKEVSIRKPEKRFQLNCNNRERLKELRIRPNTSTPTSTSTSTSRLKLPLPFKKCSKPNYPDLSDLKIKTGTDIDGSCINSDEVVNNAKKFDERVKKLNIHSEDDIDEIDGPLTKSDSSDELNMNNSDNSTNSIMLQNGYTKGELSPQPVDGSFTNTIKSKEFQQYLDKKGLTLIPKKIPNGAQSVYKKSISTPNKPTEVEVAVKQISFKMEPKSLQIANRTELNEGGGTVNQKKPSVFQRLLASSIFASTRRTTPQQTNPPAISVFNANRTTTGNSLLTKPIKRVVLERQSFHGRSQIDNRSLIPTTNFPNSQKSSNDQEDKATSSNTAADTKPTATPALKRRELQLKGISKPPRLDKTFSPETPTTTRYLPPAAEKNLNNEGEGGALKSPTEKRSMIPKRTVSVNFNRSSSMDRNEILKRSLARSKLHQRSNSIPDQRTPTLIPSTPSSITTITKKNNIQETTFPIDNGPPITSTPIKTNANKDISPISSRPSKTTAEVRACVDQKEWEKLRSIKEQTDRELYFKIKEQQQQMDNRNLKENIYEYLPGSSQASTAIAANSNFVRGSPQRNTFSGIIRSSNRRAKIIDGRPLITSDNTKTPTTDTTPARCQSVLDGAIHNENTTSRGLTTPYTPVTLRHKNENMNPSVRRIGGILTREEILQKIKEFCRKSVNKTPPNQTTPLQCIYEKTTTTTTTSNEISPVSYISLEGGQHQQRPMSRMYATPQVPQRMHSLQQATVSSTGQFMPIAEAVVSNTNTNSPIYAHVIKRGSVQSAQTQLYELPSRIVPTQYIIKREPELQPIYVQQNALQTPNRSFTPPSSQYILVDGEKLARPQLITTYHHQPAELYAQPQYIRPHQLQTIPTTVSYIAVEDALVKPQPQTQIIRARLHDGRSTPLILDRSSQHVSQIYWTPNQQLRHTTGLITDQISPRYVLKQPYSLPPIRLDQQAANRATPTIMVQHPTLVRNISLIQNQYGHLNGTALTLAPTKKPLQAQVQQLNTITTRQSPAFDWESGSEAGEVQRIMEKHHQLDQQQTEIPVNSETSMGPR